MTGSRECCRTTARRGEDVRVGRRRTETSRDGAVRSVPFAFACPSCREPLAIASANERRCPQDGTVYRRKDGIWRFLPPERADYFAGFIEEYEMVRKAEGRGGGDPGVYRALPFEDRTGRYKHEWRVRAESFRALLSQVAAPLEEARGRPLRTLDLGAGNGWLSYRLAERGHRVAAVDLLTNDFDGLGTHVYYDAHFIPVQAEFARLPFQDDRVDLTVFNASLHYAADYERTLAEALRVLQEDGLLVIMDSPVYREESSGEQMVRERSQRFERTYGFPSDAIPSEGYLTYDRLEHLARVLGVAWEAVRPFYGPGWTLNRWKARLLGRREPATFMLIVGRRA